MTTRHFTRTELTTLGVPPDDPTDIEYDDHLIEDEQVGTLKYTASRRCVFRAPDDGKTYAVEYEARLDVGDYEVNEYSPEDHGWYGDTVEGIEVEEQQVMVTRWLPVDDTTP